MTKQSCRLLTLAVLTGMAVTSVAMAVPVNSRDAAQLSETKGTVRQYTFTPRGDVDGFILIDGTEVKVPKHLSTQLVYAVRPGDAVTVRGLKAFALPLIDATTITNDATRAVVVDNGPPGPDRRGSVTTITGKVSASLHGPRGEVNAAILENATILRLGPREAASQSTLLQPGQTIAARGVSSTTILGTVMEVEAIGASPNRLVELGPSRRSWTWTGAEAR
jgi:hypothetical protein